MELSKLAEACEWPHGLILDEDQVKAQATQAARFYLGYAAIASLEVAGELTASTELSNSEWAVIGPLFRLYVERENARALEASRNMGLEVYGRQVDTIEQDIVRIEDDLPRRAFSQAPVTV